MKKPEFLKKVKKVYLVGIKGVAMTAMACCFQDLGIKISGSDVEEKFVTDLTLKSRQIKWQVGFQKELMLKWQPDLVVTTGAHGGLNNPQVKAASQAGIKVLTHAQALGELMKNKEGISVCGVGGKTTTSAMITTVLDKAGKKPSFAIGVASLKPLGAPGAFKAGPFFVAEADEYANSPGSDNRPRFLFQKPKVIVVTNIEYDHPDVYRNLAQTKNAYAAFFEKLPQDGCLIACVDNANTKNVIQKFKGQKQTYGFSPQADWQASEVRFGAGKTTFCLSHQGVKVENISLQVPGRFNVLNAAAVFAASTFLGLDFEAIKKGLAAFGGSKRRFEFIGEKSGVKLYDDYAHHPQEIQAVLKAAKLWFAGQRIIVVFQPHTYSRTKALFHEFARSFSLAKEVVVTDIYASAREKNDLEINSHQLAQAASQFHPRVVYQPEKKAVIKFLQKEVKPGDVVFTLGAGDLFLWHQDILKSFKP